MVFLSPVPCGSGHFPLVPTPDTLYQHISNRLRKKHASNIRELKPEACASTELPFMTYFRGLVTTAFVAVSLFTSAAAQPSPAAPAPQTPAAGQQTPPASPSAKQPSSPDQPNPNIKKQEQTGTSNDRLFFALPNFLTVESTNVPPLTAGQKFKVVARGAFDYIQIPWYAALAGISQASNSEPGYGQGAEGYGKRLGAYAADGVIENFMVGAVLPSILRQDPRYYQMGKGGFWRRSGHAVGRIFISPTDSGHRQFNFSEIFGSAAAAAISTYSYHPSADRTLSNTASVWGSQVGYDTITLVIKEFWPDIRRKFSKKKTASAP